MFTSQLLADHAVLKYILLALQAMNPSLDPHSTSFDYCPAITTSKTRCKRARSSRQQSDAAAFVTDVQGFDDWPTADNFPTRIDCFFKDVYCYQHFEKARDELFAIRKRGVELAIASSVHEAADGADSEPRGSMSLAGDVTIETQETVTSEPGEGAEMGRIAEQLTTLSVSATTQADTSCDPNTPPKIFKIRGLGMASIVRKGSVRDGSKVTQEMYKHLLDREQEYGIVYVLKNTQSDDLFKIGYTKQTAAKRLAQPGNCLKANSDVDIVYESSCPFFAAQKAEKLAQTVLKNHNLCIKKCDVCEGGHKEWFQASEDVVLGAVKAMEHFVRFPAYEQSENGKWKLTDTVDQAIQDLCRLDLQKLVGSLSKPDLDSPAQEDEPLQTQAGQDTPKPVPGDTTPLARAMSNVSGPSAGSATSLSALDSSQDMSASPASGSANEEFERLPGKKSFGTRAAQAKKKFAKRVTAVRRQSSETWRRLQNGMLSPNGSQAAPEQTDPGKESPPETVSDVMTGVLWSVMPEHIKDVKDSDVKDTPTREDDRPDVLQRGKSFREMLKQSVRKQFEDYQKELNRKDESDY